MHITQRPSVTQRPGVMTRSRCRSSAENSKCWSGFWCSGFTKPLEKNTPPCPTSTSRSGQVTTRQKPAVMSQRLFAPPAAYWTRQKPAVTLRKNIHICFYQLLPKLSWVNPGLLGRPSSFLGYYKYSLDPNDGIILFSLKNTLKP